jgi:hypothetical protein
LHPLQIDLDLPPPGGEMADGEADWVLAAVSLEIDGQRVLSEQPITSANTVSNTVSNTVHPPAGASGGAHQSVSLWQGELSPGPHALVALLLYQRQPPGGGPLDEIQVEQPRRFHITAGRPLALQLTPVRPRPPISAQEAATWRSAAAPPSVSSRCDRP